MTARNGITLQDVYNVVNRLEDKIDRRLTEIEDRVDIQESFRNRAMALIGVVATFSSVISTWIWDRIVGRGN